VFPRISLKGSRDPRQNLKSDPRQSHDRPAAAQFCALPKPFGGGPGVRVVGVLRVDGQFDMASIQVIEHGPIRSPVSAAIGHIPINRGGFKGIEYHGFVGPK